MKSVNEDMMVYKNKHVVAALIIAPILAIMSYFAVDAMVSEKPHFAKTGESYKLAEKPNCRYTSGVCDLKNGDFEVRLLSEEMTSESFILQMTSVFPLQGAKVALMKDVNEDTAVARPMDMVAGDEQGLSWSARLDNQVTENSRLQLVLSAENVLYFGEAHLTFTQYKTSFDEDFRR